MKILLAEDDKLALAVLRRALMRLGHETIEAKDGEEAWGKLQDEGEEVRVVVSDWEMPTESGLDLCRRVRQRLHAPYVYFILLTARDATNANQLEAMDAGVDDFLTKPLDEDELQRRLHVAKRILHCTTQVRQLEALLPICSCCKKIRDDHNYWQQMETYINERTGSEFSHSICPDCYERVVVPELARLGIARHAKPNPPA